MEITDIRIRLTQNAESKLCAVASITFDESFVVHDIKVFSKDDGGYYITMPSRRIAAGEYIDIAHPINNETRNKIAQKIIAAYEKELALS